jgi:hypothetical protein
MPEAAEQGHSRLVLELWSSPPQAGQQIGLALTAR